jgi:hypothetical protein
MLRLVLAGVVAVLLLTASPALAGTREQILQQCQDGRLTGDFTVKEIRDARNNIPTDIDQYSDCRDVLSRAIAGRAGGAGGGGGGGGAAGGGGGGGGTGGGGTLTPSTPQDQKAIADAAARGDTPVKVDGGTVVPGASGFEANAARNPLPPGLIAVLVLLGIAAAAGAAPLLKRLGGVGSLSTLGRRVLARGR